MSNRRRPKAARSQRGWPKAGPDQGYASVPAIVPDRLETGAIDNARNVTHDELINAWGPRRASGIWWTEYLGAEARRQYLRHCLESKVEPGEELALFDNPRVALVIAWAIANGEPVGPMVTGWRGGDHP